MRSQTWLPQRARQVQDHSAPLPASRGRPERPNDFQPRCKRRSSRLPPARLQGLPGILECSSRLELLSWWRWHQRLTHHDLAHSRDLQRHSRSPRTQSRSATGLRVARLLRRNAAGATLRARPSENPMRGITMGVQPRAQRRSIQLKGGFVVLLQGRVLVFLAQVAIAYCQDVQLGAHETPEGLFRGTDDGFTAHIEAGVSQHRAVG